MTVATLRIEDLKLDGGTQTRAEINKEAVSDYAEAMQGGTEFPPITVFYDGTDYWLADGFHRVQAMRQIGRTETGADVRQGSRRDAVLHSVGANANHGLRRTNDDKRRAVIRLLEDAEWSQWSDREIARRAGVSNRFVSNLRPTSSVNGSQIERKVTRNGKTYTQDTTNIGSTPKPPPSIPFAAKEPELSQKARDEGAQFIGLDELMQRAQEAFLRDAGPEVDEATGELPMTAEEAAHAEALAEQAAALDEAKQREVGEHAYEPLPAEVKLKIDRLAELSRLLERAMKLCDEIEPEDFGLSITGQSAAQMTMLAVRKLTALLTPPAPAERDSKTLDMETA